MPRNTGYGYRGQRNRRYSPIRPTSKSRTLEAQDQEDPNKDPQMVMTSVGTIEKRRSDYLARRKTEKEALALQAKKESLKPGADAAGKTTTTGAKNATVSNAGTSTSGTTGMATTSPTTTGVTGAAGAGGAATTSSVGASSASAAGNVAAADSAGAATAASTSGGTTGGGGAAANTSAGASSTIAGSAFTGAGAGYGAGKAGEGVATYYGANQDQSRAVGFVAAASAGAAVGGGWGAVGGVVAYGGGMVLEENSWLCSATLAYVGLTEEEEFQLSKLRKHSIKNNKKAFKFYSDTGSDLMKIINSTEKNLSSFFSEFKKKVLTPVVNFMKEGEKDKALNLYDLKTRELYSKYLPNQELP